MKIFILFWCLSIFGEEGLDTGIHGLKWKAGPIPIIRELRIGTYQIVVSGIFDRPGWKLYLGNYEIKLNEQNEFHLPIPVTINNIKAEFFARNAKGDFENEIITIHLNEFFQPGEKDRRKIGRTRRWFEKQLRDMSFNFGLGPTLLSYDQTSLPTVSQTGFTPKAELTYVFAQNAWSFESSTYLSLFSSLKLFGADAKLGYEMPLVEGRLAFYLFGGFYYATSFGSDTMGYSGVWGPVAYPALRATFRNGSTASLYAKYSPVLNGVVPMTLDNASATVGVSYFFKPFSGQTLRGVPFGLSFEATRLKLGLEGGSLAVNTYTLSGNLLF